MKFHSILPSFFYMIPIVYYFIQSWRLGIPTTRPHLVLQHSSTLFIILVALPFFIGYGMNRNKRWIWIIATEYSILSILFLAWNVIASPTLPNLIFLSGVLIIFPPILFYFRSEIKIAYREDFLARSWRKSRRYQLSIPITINGNNYTTIDISNTGLAIHVPQNRIDFKENETIIFQLENTEFIFFAVLTRQSGQLAAFQFKNLSKEQSKIFKKHILNIRKQRYKESRLHFF